MSNEDYLIACGWTRIGNEWMRRSLASSSDFYSLWTTDEAVKRQLADDRARLAFVLTRSVMTATWPDGKTLTLDVAGTDIAWKER